MKYIIYKITSPIGKIYIGQTKNYKKRMYDHCHGRKNKRNSIIHNAIKEYGKDNMVFEKIVRCETRDIANKLEKHFIKLYNTIAPNGYNILDGGECTNHHISTKILLSLMVLG